MADAINKFDKMFQPKELVVLKDKKRKMKNTKLAAARSNRKLHKAADLAIPKQTELHSLHNADSEENPGSNSDQLEIDNDVENLEDDEISLQESEGSNSSKNEYLFCENCKRGTWDDITLSAMGLDEMELYNNLVLEHADFEDIHFCFKWSLMSSSDYAAESTLMLCSQCVTATTVKGSHKDGVAVWPAFIWHLLSNKTVRETSGMEIWRLIPRKWRKWWLIPASQLNGLEEISEDFPPPHVEEITMDMDEISTAMENLIWQKLAEACDKHLLVPKVKCPWGCCQLLNLARGVVPFDILYLDYLQQPLGSKAMSNGKNNWMDGVRPDFLVSKHYVLKEEWGHCAPSIIFKKGKGPMMATCGKHSTRSFGQYVHPPEHPCGNVSTESADQFAPAVALPRVVSSVQRRAYSDRYHVVKMKGNYEGVDTMTVCNRGNYGIANQLSMHQDAIAMACRPDVAENISRLGDEKFISDGLKEAKFEQQHAFCPQEKAKVIKDIYRKGSTYINVEDALQLETSIKKETDYEIYYTDLVNPEESCFIQFSPRWPRDIIWVNAANKYGSKPCSAWHVSLKEKKRGDIDWRSVWSSLLIATQIPRVWHAVANDVTTNLSWQGWLLAFAGRNVFGHWKNRGSRNNPFRKRKSLHEISGLMFPDNEQNGYHSFDVSEEFGKLKGLCGLSGQELSANIMQPLHTVGFIDVTEKNDVLIVNNAGSNEHLPQLFTSSATTNKTWQLCMIVWLDATPKMKHVVMKRHGGFHEAWWRLSLELQHYVWRKNDNNLWSEGECWNYCVYCCVSHGANHQAKLKKEYLRLAGSEAKGTCAIHGLHLVCSSSFNMKSTRCAKCGCDKTEVDCPHAWCANGLCKSHLSEELTANIANDTFIVHPWVLPTIDFSSNGSCSEDSFKSDTGIVDSPDNSINRMNFVDGEDDSNISDDSSRSSSDSELDLDPNSGSPEDDWETPLSDDENIDVTSLSDSMASDVLQQTNFVAMVDIPEKVFETDDLNLDAVDTAALHLDMDGETVQSNAVSEQNGSLPANATFHLAETVGMATKADARYECDPSMMGSNVIFNKHGRLLARKRSKFITTRQQKNFIQKLIAQGKTSVPLLYPEGALFYSIFWDAMPDGAITGALPTALLCGDRVLGEMNIANLRDQIRTRLMNTSLLCAADFKYQFFTLDQLVNLGCRGNDTRLVLSRGFGETLESSSGMRMNPNREEVSYHAENMESRPLVQKIASAIGERMATWFYTHTVSMKDHLVIKHLKACIDSPEAMKKTAERMGFDPDNLSISEQRKIQKDLIACSCSVFVHAWANMSEIWMHYMCKSPEKPAGTIYWAVLRREMQELVANLCHWHNILWCEEDDGTPEGLEFLLDKIRASMTTIVTPDEYEEMRKEKIFSSKEELFSILSDLKKKLLHRHHRRCLVPQSKWDALGSLHASSGSVEKTKLLNMYRCKVPDNRLLSPNPNNKSFLYINVRHTESAQKVLFDLGLAVAREIAGDLDAITDYRQLCYVDSSLQAKRYIPPTTAEDGVLSPVFAKLCIINPNSDNVQYTDSYGVAKYLAKYIAQVDESARVFMKAPSTNGPQEYRLTAEETGNTKITSVRAEVKKAAMKERRNFVGRLMTQTEALHLHFNIPPLTMNIQFVHISTVPLEERSAMDRIRPLVHLYRQNIIHGQINSNLDVDARKVIPVILARHAADNALQLPVWRRHTISDTTLAKDQLFSPWSLDSVTIFGLRPPELSFVTEQALYHKWFARKPIKCKKAAIKESGTFGALVGYCKKHFSLFYDRCLWIDSTSCQVTVRVAALPSLITYIQQCPLTKFAGSRNEKIIVLSFFSKALLLMGQNSSTIGIRSNSQQDYFTFLTANFLSAIDKKYLPVVWFRPIKPTHTSRWLFHILLSLGSFRNEMDLLSSGSLRDAFVTAQLLKVNDIVGSRKNIMKKYVSTQLQHMPGGTRQFDRMIVAADNALRFLFEQNEIAAEGTPPYLYTHLRESTEAAVDKAVKIAQKTFYTVLLHDMESCALNNLPSLEQLCGPRSMRQQYFNMLTDAPQHNRQSDDSYAEQTFARTKICKTFSHYMEATETCPRCPILVGDPGAGKTTVMQMVLVHALCRGLNCYMTTLMSERANQLGVIHLNILFCMPAFSKQDSPVHIAEIAIARLYRCGWKYTILVTMDVLGFDELGQISAQTISIVDIILRTVRRSVRFMGGVVLVPTMDALQLYPVNGVHPLLSSHIISCFIFLRLQHSVRAAADVNLQRIQKITRLLPHEITSEIENEFTLLFTSKCTFVNNFDDLAIPPNATYVFGKKEPGHVLQKEKIARIKQNQTYISSFAIDEQSTAEGEWGPANWHTTKILNRETKEPQELLLYCKGVYQVTFNMPGKFSQAQMVVLLQLPTVTDVKDFKPFPVLLAPPGCKQAPQTEATKESLLNLGWTLTNIPRCTPRSRQVGRHINGRRTQYGLRMFATSTIHSIMGQNCPATVTKISKTEPMYTLWQREQIIVVLSRTSLAKEMFFVGSAKETAEAILEVLKQTSQYATYISHLLDRLTCLPGVQTAAEPINTSDNTNAVLYNLHPFRPMDVEIPSDASGFVYMLVSGADPSVTYIGMTSNLVKRLNAHYAGRGSMQTSVEELRPWRLLAFICGFEFSCRKRLAVESQWKIARDTSPAHLDANQIAGLANLVIGNHHREFPEDKLIFVRTGTISIT